MSDGENILNSNDLFSDTADTPKAKTEQQPKREYLKGAISKGKLLGGEKQWTHERIEKASKKTISNSYAKYRQRQLNQKGEKTEYVLRKHVISLHLSGTAQVVKIRDIKKLQQDIENDPIIKDLMANVDCLLVCTFGNFLAPVLVAV